jgi:hypothetical protein
MDKSEAERRFQEADKLFTYGRFEDALAELDSLDASFPNNHRILNARVRTLEQLQHYDQALALCERLVNELGYEKAQSMRDRLAEEVARAAAAPQQAFWSIQPEPVSPPGQSSAPQSSAPQSSAPQEEESMSEEAPLKRRFKLKPVRFVILLGLVAGMYLGYVPYWLGGGLIGFYFVLKYIVIGLIGKWLMFKVFTAPFKLKGKALAGATCQLHGHEWTAKPTSPEEEPEDDEEEGPTVPLRYVWLDVSILPQERREGFTHWEPGELALAPASLKYTGLDDMDKCYSVHDIKMLVDGQEVTDDGLKYHGPQRLKMLFGVPLDEDRFKFVYYFEQFGELHLGN